MHPSLLVGATFLLYSERKEGDGQAYFAACCLVPCFLFWAPLEAVVVFPLFPICCFVGCYLVPCYLFWAPCFDHCPLDCTADALLSAQCSCILLFANTTLPFIKNKKKERQVLISSFDNGIHALLSHTWVLFVCREQIGIKYTEIHVQSDYKLR